MTGIRNKLIALAARLIKRTIRLMASVVRGAQGPWVRHSPTLIQNSIVIRRSTYLYPPSTPLSLLAPDYVDSLTVAAGIVHPKTNCCFTVAPETLLAFVTVPIGGEGINRPSFCFDARRFLLVPNRSLRKCTPACRRRFFEEKFLRRRKERLRVALNTNSTD